MNKINESDSVENTMISLIRDMSWDYRDCYSESFGKNDIFDIERGLENLVLRSTSSDVVLAPILMYYLLKCNLDLDDDAIADAIEEITRDRSSMNPVSANQEIYKLLREGVKVKVKNELGELVDKKVKVIDFENPENNHFLLCSQFSVTGEIYSKRCDLIGFVNGIPLILFELKSPKKHLAEAYYKNILDYKETIPQIFWYNALIVLSKGVKTKVGTISSKYEHFNEWKILKSQERDCHAQTDAELKISAKEKEQNYVIARSEATRQSQKDNPVTSSLEITINEIFRKENLLDIFENFILFHDTQGSISKIAAKYHQYYGVNDAIEEFLEKQKTDGRLGVFWHTQGAGKSFSMIFFSQKILRKIYGNYTFVIVTDRRSLDKQIYGNFASCGAVTEKKVHATNCNHLKRLLKEDHRNIFTLIQKFQEEEGKEFPVLSERDDIIVITDESHRSQYEVLAMNMRTALPNASFIAFTGTPLIVGEEKTREVFGEYVSIYNFKQSIDDGATLPIYYEKRKPEVNIINDQINQEFYDIIKDKNLEEEEEEKLETLFAKKYYLITDDDRLEIIAEDIVNHFMNRGYMGKAMVVCIDKVTTVKMYDKVKKYWGKYIKNKNRLPRHSIPRNDKENLIENSCFNSVDEMINYMKETEMYVVVSEEQFEEKKFKDKGLDIRFHRQQMQINDLDTRFKEPTDPFRIVFVCAMWMTGFDAKSLSTMYLDKPLVNHNLMQSIARVNRVYGDKSNGIIVDYIGIFDNLKKALAVYGSDPSGVIQPGEMPVQPKIKLIEQLREIQIHLFQVFKDHQIDLERLYHINGLELIRELEKTSDKILSDKDFKKEFKEISNRIMKLFKMILPDITANEFLRLISTIKLLRNIILESTITDPELKGKIEDLLEKSIDAEKVKQPLFPDFQIDLTKLDFSMLKKSFIEGRRFLTADRLRRALEDKVKKMLEQNKFRVELYEKLLRIIEEYNSGAADIEKYFKDLTKLAKQLEKEEKRHIQEGLSEEELVIFDLLYKEKLTKKENIKLKNIAKELLEILKREKLVLDWRKKQQTRAAVELTIEEELEKLIPEILAQKQLDKVTKEMFQYIYEKYPGG